MNIEQIYKDRFKIKDIVNIDIPKNKKDRAYIWKIIYDKLYIYNEESVDDLISTFNDLESGAVERIIRKVYSRYSKDDCYEILGKFEENDEEYERRQKYHEEEKAKAKELKKLEKEKKQNDEKMEYERLKKKYEK